MRIVEYKNSEEYIDDLLFENSVNKNIEQISDNIFRIRMASRNDFDRLKKLKENDFYIFFPRTSIGNVILIRRNIEINDNIKISISNTGKDFNHESVDNLITISLTKGKTSKNLGMTMHFYVSVDEIKRNKECLFVFNQFLKFIKDFRIKIEREQRKINNIYNELTDEEKLILEIIE